MCKFYFGVCTFNSLYIKVLCIIHFYVNIKLSFRFVFISGIRLIVYYSRERNNRKRMADFTTRLFGTRESDFSDGICNERSCDCTCWYADDSHVNAPHYYTRCLDNVKMTQLCLQKFPLAYTMNIKKY